MAPELQSAIVMLGCTLASGLLVPRDRLAARARPRVMKDWLGIAFLGVADAANVGLFFAAYQRTTVAIAVLTHYLTPIFVALAAPFLLKERFAGRTLGAVAIAFVGLILLLEPWRSEPSGNDLMGAALGAGSALFYASQVLVNKRLTTVFSGSELMFFHGLVGVPILWAFVPAGALAVAPASGLGILAVASVGIGALSGLMFVWGLRRIAASHASILALLEPFVAVLTAGIFLQQRIGGAPLGGGVLILGGAVLVVTARVDRRQDGIESRIEVRESLPE
jgi:drug/metabolite transporter (DMT)-like permease